MSTAPASIVRLVVAGYALVVLPLLVALIIVLLEIGHLASQGHDSALRAGRATDLSRTLVAASTAMQRTLAQYHVLGDASLYAAYGARRAAVHETVRALGALDASPRLAELARQFAVTERALFERFGARPDAALHVDRILTGYADLVAQGRLLRDESDALVRREANRTIAMADGIERVVVLLCALSIPATALLALWSTRAIVRPIRALDEAVRRLGAGDFSHPVEIGGPGDLRALGERLDWLRLRILELEDEKLRFLHAMSRDLRVPLATLRDGAELLADMRGDASAPERDRITRVLCDKTLELQQLVERVLEFTRARERHPPGRQCASVPLKPMLEKVLRESSPSIDRKDISVNLRLCDATIEGDADEIRIVLDNLVSNAVECSPPGGQIAIEFEVRGEAIAITIGDGAPEHAAAGAHQPAAQALTVGSNLLQGTSLEIVQTYVSANRGRVERVFDAGGGAVRLVFPVADAAVHGHG